MIAFAYYLLKVIICSGVLFLYYHLALRNKLFHQWNRFYLLAGVALSLLAPLFQVSIRPYAAGEPNKAIKVLEVIQSAGGYLEEATIEGQKHLSVYQWLGIMYGMVSAVLFLTLLFSLAKIFSIIKTHTVRWVERIRFINTRVEGTPFSFFRFIFWNEEIDLHTETGQQIFQHELVHVRENHTLDKLLIQLVLTIFWCNPFFWLIRRELKLIHEFIADKKAAGEYGTAALAAMILSSSFPGQFNPLINSFFQTPIKRRLAMLTKIQSAKITYFSRILALPVLALTVLAFTLRTRDAGIPLIRLEKQFTVVIDPGHGMAGDGSHSGAVDNGVYEDDITLAIARKISELNTDAKLKIVLTRSSDQAVDLGSRVEVARRNNADLFISIHVNAADPGQNSDSYSAQTKNQGFEIYVSNRQPVYQQQSEVLGSALEQELASVYSTNPALLKRNTGILVLDKNVCPSVLVECGFLTDPKDKEFITKEQNQALVAKKILTAVGKYALAQQEGRERPDTLPKVQQSKEMKIRPAGPAGKETKAADLTKNSGQTPPVYFVDGKEKDKSELAKIDPAAIESINILKSKSALDKYGKKGAHGVVEITMKKPGRKSRGGAIDTTVSSATGMH